MSTLSQPFDPLTFSAIPAGTADNGATLSQADFQIIAALVHRETGILITQARKTMLVSRLTRRLRHLGVTDFSSYIQLLTGPHGQEERQALISVVTTNVTGFFREPHHFDRLSTLAPHFLDRAKADMRVRIWSAGCSTGQEAYSIAATLLQAAPELAQHDLLVLGTDIDPEVVQRARAGVYSLPAGLSPGLARLAPFVSASSPEGSVEISAALKAITRFEVLNLLDRWPFSRGFDVIFCRNVVIYFDSDTRLKLWSRFASLLPEGGTLFLGHSERMDPLLEKVFVPVGITEYRRAAGALPAPPEPGQGPH